MWTISKSFYDDGVDYVTLDGPMGSDPILACIVQALNACVKPVEDIESAPEKP